MNDSIRLWNTLYIFQEEKLIAILKFLSDINLKVHLVLVDETELKEILIEKGYHLVH